MASPDPLTQLKDIHLPAPVGWWPLAPGWYFLLALLLILIIFLGSKIYKKYQHGLAKKRALTLLNRYHEYYKKEAQASLASTQISALLRRVALVYYPRSQVASLHGEAWIQFLTQSSRGIDFTSVRTQLLETPFKTQENLSIEPLFDCAKCWIQQRGIPCSK